MAHTSVRALAVLVVCLACTAFASSRHDTPSTSTTYTPTGQLKSQQEQGATSLGGTQSWRFDGQDRLIQSTSPLGQISYTLDAAGNPVERSVSNTSTDAGTAKATFDAAGRLSQVTAPDGKQTRYSYDPTGRLVLTERDLNATPGQAGQAQVLRTHQAYDSADRVVAIAHVKQTGGAAGPTTLVAGQALTRDAGGAVSRIDLYSAGFGATAPSFDANTGSFSGTVARSQSFEFDANARLTRDNTVDAATPAQSSDTRYTHDAVGNRATKTTTTGGVTSVTTYSYDSADRLLQESTTVGGGSAVLTIHQWDGNGNLAAKLEPGKATLYRFDPQNRLIDIRTGTTVTAAQAATADIAYAYDAAGSRVKKTAKVAASPGNTSATSYLMDSNQAYPQVALESTATTGASPSTQSTAYVWGNQLIRQTRGSAASLYPAADAANDLFPLQGHLNTSLGAVDANGNLVEQTPGDAYGQLATPTGLKQSHLYTGEYWDQDSQLLYLRARWYDPRIGRFVSADPFEGKQADSRSLNRYVYVGNDPVHASDPTGEMGLGELAIGMEILGSIASQALSVYQLVDKIETSLTVAQVMMQLRVAAQNIPWQQMMAGAQHDQGFMQALADIDEAAVALTAGSTGILRHLTLDQLGREKIQQFLKNPKNDLLFYGPTPDRKTPWFTTGQFRPTLGQIKIGKNMRQIKLEIGRSSGFGMGNTQGSGSGHRQWFRMDWHPAHGAEAYDWKYKQYHFHTRTAP